MVKELIRNEYARLMAARTARTALRGYRLGLRTKIYATDMAISQLDTYARAKKVGKIQENKKENKDMKNFLAGLTAVAVTGAVLGTAGYYLYKKYNEDKEYDDILFTEDDDEDDDFGLGEVEDEEDEEDAEDVKEKVVTAAADVKDIVSDAAENLKTTVAGATENVKSTVSGAYTDVKEAIEGAMKD